MNSNALKKKSSIKIEKTATGKCKCGFRKTDGYIMPEDEYYAELKKNGYKVEFTSKGVFISK